MQKSFSVCLRFQISPAGSRKSLDSVGLSGGVGAEGGVIGSGLVTFTDSNPVLDEAFSSRCDDATSVVSSTAAGSDLIAAAMTTYSLDDTGSTCSSKHESPIRRPPMMQPQQTLQQQAMQHQPLPHHQPVAPVLVPTFNGCISPIASSPIPQQQQTQVCLRKLLGSTMPQYTNFGLLLYSTLLCKK